MKLKVLLILIILLSIVVRFWKIEEFPAGFNADEAAYAYNAYSLLQTGKDEFGNSWPINFVSFADYKPGETTYFMLPFIALFGLDQTVVRFPAIFAGVLSVFLIYLLTKKLFGNEEIALFSALFLAISPWHIHFSRGAWETNLATTFLLAGTYFFFKGLEKPKYFILWTTFYAISMYTYHTPRVVAPLLSLFLVVYFRKTILKQIKPFAVAIITGLIIMIPFILSFNGPAVSARFSGVSVFSDTGSLWEINRARGEHDSPNSLEARLLHNKLILFSQKIGQNWLSHFNGNFLFISGDKIKRSNAPDSGEMYLFDSIFILAGLYLFVKNKEKNALFVLFWLMVAPIAASLTFQSPNALRSHNMMIPLVIISAYGCYYLVSLVRKKLTRKMFTLFSLLFLAIISIGFYNYLHQYFNHYQKVYPEAWEYGYNELVDYLKPIKDNYKKVYVTEKYDQPYIIFLFYLKYPPEKFQKEAILTARDKFGFSTVRDFDNYHFENIIWNNLKDSNILVCGTSQEIPENAKIIKTINFKNDQPAFLCAEK